MSELLDEALKRHNEYVPIEVPNATLLEALSAVERVVADEFCMELECEIVYRPESFTEREKKMQEKLAEIYRIAHGSNPRHSCYRVHDSWRKETVRPAEG